MSSQFYTQIDAWALTELSFNRQVFANSFRANQLAQLMSFDTVLDGSNSKSVFRRAYGEFTDIKYLSPNSAILNTKDPKIVEIRSMIRDAVAQPAMSGILRRAFTNNPARQPDPLAAKAMLVMQELARAAWATAITGKYTDSCTIASNGSGRLKFAGGTKKASYSAPGDPDYGEESAALAPGDVVKLRSAHKDAYIEFTVGALPAGDAQAELIFSTTTNQPDGLIALMESGQKSSFGVPTAVTFEHLDALIDQLHGAYRNNRMTVLCMDAAQKRALKSLNRMMGGSTLETAEMWELMVNVPDDLKSLALDKVEIYNGHPLLTIDDMPTKLIAGKVTKPIIAVCLDPMVSEGMGVDHGGFYGLLRGGPNQNVVQQHGFGWNIRDLGLAYEKDEEAIRITLSHAWALGSSGAASMKEGFFNT